MPERVGPAMRTRPAGRCWRGGRNVPGLARRARCPGREVPDAARRVPEPVCKPANSSVEVRRLARKAGNLASATRRALRAVRQRRLQGSAARPQGPQPCDRGSGGHRRDVPRLARSAATLRAKSGTRRLEFPTSRAGFAGRRTGRGTLRSGFATPRPAPRTSHPQSGEPTPACRTPPVVPDGPQAAFRTARAAFRTRPPEFSYPPLGFFLHRTGHLADFIGSDETIAGRTSGLSGGCKDKRRMPTLGCRFFLPPRSEFSYTPARSGLMAAARHPGDCARAGQSGRRH